MTGHNYPDHFYADALAKDQKPTGAYRAPAEMPEAERKLRTALAYVNHARELIRDALGENEPKASTPEPERTPKWHVDYIRDQRQQHPMHAETLRDHDERLAGGESHL